MRKIIVVLLILAVMFPFFALQKADASAEVSLLIFTHKVKRGENLYRISKMYGMPLKEAVEINNIKDSRYIRPGQLIKIIPRPVVVKASWYGPGFHGNDMANGERFDENNPALAAHKYIPLGTWIRVVNLRTGRSIKACVGDRGPFIRGRGLDLSKAAAKKIGMYHKGVEMVRITVLAVSSGRKCLGEKG